MEALKVPEHAHALELIDLQLQYPHYEEEEDDDDDEGGDPKEGFQDACERCDQEINMYHRYYYKCMGDSSCHFSLHKFSAELSKRLEHTLHPHPLIQHSMDYDWICRVCNQERKNHELCYYCSECCFAIDVNCAVEVGKKIIHHPCHHHLLMCAIPKPILCECSACGKRHEGIFYQCTTCVGFIIHNDCAFLPNSLLIQHTTNDAFYHIHPLIISYSFPLMDQIAKHYPRCRVCGKGFFYKEILWIYKCDKCMFYAHVDCATSRREPFMSIFLSAGLGKIVKNFKDVDNPYLLHLPFPDETYSVPKHLSLQESGTSQQESGTSHQVNLKHTSHQHPLILVDQTQNNVQTSSKKIDSWLLMCHDPMKKTQLLCNGCLRPIMSTMPFYKCAHSCNFALHEWCTRLPTKIVNHPGHTSHTLFLMYPNVLPFFFGVFECSVCRLPCNGFSYCCVECKYYVDITCGFMPRQITHKAHPNHLLSIVKKRGSCHMCENSYRLKQPYLGKQLYFSCNVCDICIHPECALLLPERIRHKYDKHPMNLSYLPIENHKGEYFCEMCEEELNPHESFYHCQECAQSMHSACAPLIPQCEIDTTPFLRSVYYFVNIKFGGIHNSDGHPHPLSFAQGIVSDGQCNICFHTLDCSMVFKCLECKFAIDYKCCARLSKI